MWHLRLGPLNLVALAVFVACGGDGQPAGPHEAATTIPSGPTTGKIAFQCLYDGGSDICVVNADGSSVTRLTDASDFAAAWSPDDTASDFAPAWSPDGTRIAFLSDRVTDELFDVGIYVVDADGSNLTQMPVEVVVQGSGGLVWSPDGSRIAYSFASGRGDDEGIHLIDAAGSGGVMRLITEGSAAPAWSPDGSRIAFITCCTGMDDLFVVNADGSNPTRIATEAAGSAAWAPDGGRIAFVSVRGGNLDIYVVDADGSNPTRLTDDSALDFRPLWSPDGSRIAFTSQRDGNSEIYVMNADGSGLARLTHDPARDDLAFGSAWSPDGRFIAFTRFIVKEDGGGSADVYVVSADGSGETRLTTDGAASPVWSPVP